MTTWLFYLPQLLAVRGHMATNRTATTRSAPSTGQGAGTIPGAPIPEAPTMIGSSKESTMNYTAKQMAAIAEFCGYATKVNPEGDRIRPDDLIIHEKLHNDDPKDGRLDLTVVALTSEIVV